MDWTIADETTQPITTERAIVPAGIHAMVVKAAEEGPNEYKRSDENPDGMCLKLRLATVTGDYKFVFDDIPRHLGWRAKQLAEALGVLPNGTTVSLEPDDLVGREITVEVSHYTSKAGKVSAVVKRYVQGTPKPKAATKPRTTVARVATAGSDDIPF